MLFHNYWKSHVGSSVESITINLVFKEFAPLIYAISLFHSSRSTLYSKNMTLILSLFFSLELFFFFSLFFRDVVLSVNKKLADLKKRYAKFDDLYLKRNRVYFFL